MKRALRRLAFVTLMTGIAVTLPPATGNAQLFAIPASAFPVGATLLTFDGLADGVEVNGLVLSGIAFSYSLGSGEVLIDGGPGITNNVNPQNAVSVGNPNGVLTVVLPGFFDLFGFGYALLTSGVVTNATTITAFSGATTIGSLAFTANNDATFSGGFAGIQSTTPFDRVQFSFNTITSPAFAFDNVRVSVASNVSTVPEPSTSLLVGAGIVTMIGRMRSRRKAT